MSLKLVDKPEGWDLRNLRAAKENDASKWECADVLFDAQEIMKTRPPAVAAAVIWYSRNENGSITLKYTCAHEHDRQLVALAADFLSEMASGATSGAE
jgi:hypothetical protein